MQRQSLVPLLALLLAGCAKAPAKAPANAPAGAPASAPATAPATAPPAPAAAPAGEVKEGATLHTAQSLRALVAGAQVALPAVANAGLSAATPIAPTDPTVPTLQ